MLQTMSSRDLTELYAYWEIEGEERYQRDLMLEAVGGLKKK